ncbi:hypothetical protein WME75_26145 [Sorangium sp. So ce1014]|uniref:hypothetical protein n=1 Tax=Sorangium sp. So ce1014 TaxID=3133326 RepID=UPI003F62A24B
MSRLTCAAGLALAITVVAPAARGEGDVNAAPAPAARGERPVEAAPPASPPPPRRWSLGTRIGYAYAWNTGQSHLDLGTGLAGGVTFRVPIHLEIGVVYHGGSTISAGNDTIVYWSRQWSVLGHAAVGYELRRFANRFVVRPQMIVGGVFLSDTTQAGATKRHGVETLFTFGPGADLLVRFAGLHAGLDLRALFVPARVASPIGGIYGAFGFER